MVHGKNRIPYRIDRRLSGLAGPDYDATISFGLPLEPEDSQYGKSRVDNVEDLDRVLFIKPRFPVLGGIPHAHNALFPVKYLKNKPTWNNIHKYLRPAFEGLWNHWSQLMTCNINTQPDHTGKVDTAGNIQGLAVLDHVVRLCQPKVILLCGGNVHEAARSWIPPQDTRIARVAHPSMWHRTSMHLPNGKETATIVRQSLFGS